VKDRDAARLEAHGDGRYLSTRFQMLHGAVGRKVSTCLKKCYRAIMAIIVARTSNINTIMIDGMSHLALAGSEGAVLLSPAPCPPACA